MEQSIGRVTMADGTELAHASVGAGRALLYISGWLSHLESSWQMTAERAFYEALTRGCRLVRYDRAGCGLSSARIGPPTLEGELEQIDAVVATLGDEPFDVLGISMGAPVAVAWAVSHPERIRRLVLYGGWANGDEISAPAVRDHVLGLVESHWGLGSDVLTEIFAPDTDLATRAAVAAYQRASSTAATARSLLALSYALDVRALLVDVRAPTLVEHRDGDRAAPVAQARALAEGIRGAQLVVLPGRSHLPFAGDADALVRAIRRFLGLRAPPRRVRSLTGRQREVAELVSQGCTNKQIAARLGIDERSAEGHVERIRLRLGFRSRAQIAAWHAAQGAEPTRPAK